MEGNYRQHYLLAATEASNGLPQTASVGVKRQQQMAAFNGLAASHNGRQQQQQHQQQQQLKARQDSLPGNYCPPLASNSKFSSESTSMESQRLARYFGQVALEEQQRPSANQQRLGRGEYCASGERQPQTQTHHNNIHHQHQNQNSIFDSLRQPGAGKGNAQVQQQQQQHHASQLRSSQTQAQRQLHHHQQQQQKMMMQQASSSSKPPVAATTSQQQQDAATKGLHVNFNRANQAAGPEEGESRKKKYLTAKYGQQQMNLIKKRLKIEMWLCEQLQELAKGSKAEAELDEIDIDLDRLLDMDDDDTRRRWLRKTLEPFDDLQPDRLDKFIGSVLEQSKLL